MFSGGPAGAGRCGAGQAQAQGLAAPVQLGGIRRPPPQRLAGKGQAMGEGGILLAQAQHLGGKLLQGRGAGGGKRLLGPLGYKLRKEKGVGGRGGGRERPGGLGAGVGHQQDGGRSRARPRTAGWANNRGVGHLG